jgi:hypothetical protein
MTEMTPKVPTNSLRRQLVKQIPLVFGLSLLWSFFWPCQGFDRMRFLPGGKVEGPTKVWSGFGGGDPDGWYVRTLELKNGVLHAQTEIRFLSWSWLILVAGLLSLLLWRFLSAGQTKTQKCVSWLIVAAAILLIGGLMINSHRVQSGRVQISDGVLQLFDDKSNAPNNLPWFYCYDAIAVALVFTVMLVVCMIFIWEPGCKRGSGPNTASGG